MTPEEITKKRQAREDRVKSAWAELALNKSLKTVLAEDLEPRFGPCRDLCAEGDEEKTHKTAKNAGQASVITHILKRLNIATKQLEEDDDSPTRTKHAA